MDTRMTLKWLRAPDEGGAVDVLIESAVVRTCPVCQGVELAAHYPTENCPDYLVECGCQDGTVEDNVLLEYEMMPGQEDGA